MIRAVQAFPFSIGRNMSPTEVVSEILRVFKERGHRVYGERVTEQQHALQCATLARGEGEDELLVAACLLHDYGHLLHNLAEDIAERGVDAGLERIAANQLSAWFPQEVVEPIRLHAAAKRYLCWKEPKYFGELSNGSRKSLALQGGPMTAEEARAFESDPYFDRAIRLRRYDDRGKRPDAQTLDLGEFRPLLESLVRR